MDRRSVLRAAAGVVTIGAAGCLGGPQGDVREGDDGEGGPATPGSTLAGSPTLASPAFDDGGSIPARFSCDGADVSPELTVGDVPGAASSLALLVDDPDAPGGTFTHWLLWGVPPATATIPEDVPRGEAVEGLDGARQGRNDAGVVGYTGPCPPTGDGPHSYRFWLFALAEPLELEAGAGRAAFDDAVGAVAGSEALLRGTYER